MIPIPPRMIGFRRTSGTLSSARLRKQMAAAFASPSVDRRSTPPSVPALHFVRNPSRLRAAVEQIQVSRSGARDLRQDCRQTLRDFPSAVRGDDFFAQGVEAGQRLSLRVDAAVAKPPEAQKTRTTQSGAAISIGSGKTASIMKSAEAKQCFNSRGTGRFCSGSL